MMDNTLYIYEEKWWNQEGRLFWQVKYVSRSIKDDDDTKVTRCNLLKYDGLITTPQHGIPVEDSCVQWIHIPNELNQFLILVSKHVYIE